ncbi:GtrA family protein [Acetonema longum]|uniref:GtrA family protein n=1 Tax=Acetonema longum DSM 6540 TaxID=1009370 RepID=F7NMD6_9FIRM|nr:GtrA family protein [Acetonema longum]EGO62812.1 GtrA family protein [Acetonema longum DSM 6540]
MLKSFVKFSLVGASGVVVNMAVYTLAMYAGLHYLAAAIIAFCFAVTNNFYWNLIWTFRGQGNKSTRDKYCRFVLVSVLNLVVNLLILKTLVESFSLDKALAQLVAIGLVSLLNFVMNRRFTFND